MGSCPSFHDEAGQCAVSDGIPWQRLNFLAKARKKSAAKAEKAKRGTHNKAKTKSKVTKVKAKGKTKTPAARKARPKAQPEEFTAKVASADQVVVDTVKETSALRNKMESPGTSETQ